MKWKNCIAPNGALDWCVAFFYKHNVPNGTSKMKFEKTLNMEFENKKPFSKIYKSRRDVMFVEKQITILQVP
jgi:hypothetical protein